MTRSNIFINYNNNGDKMQVKLFDEDHEKDLELAINEYLKEHEVEVVDIKYQVSIAMFAEEQLYCFSAMLIYR